MSLQGYHRVSFEHMASPSQRMSRCLRFHQSPRNRVTRRRYTAIVDFKDGECLLLHRRYKEFVGLPVKDRRAGAQVIQVPLWAEPYAIYGTKSYWAAMQASLSIFPGAAEAQQVQQPVVIPAAEAQQLQQPLIIPARRIPQSLEEVDNGQILGFGADLADDHPGYLDQAYKDRRRDIGNLACTHKVGQPIPRLEYTAEELHVWATVLRELKDLYSQHACAEFLRCFPLFNFNEHEVRILATQPKHA